MLFKLIKQYFQWQLMNEAGLTELPNSKTLRRFTYTAEKNDTVFPLIEQKNKAITLYTGDRVGAALDPKVRAFMHDPVPITRCDGKGKFYSGRHNDEGHEKWHSHANQTEFNHFHLISGAHPDKMTPMEVSCLFNWFKDFQNRKGYCKDGKTNCMFSDEMEKDVRAKFRHYYKSKEIHAKVKELAEQFYNTLMADLSCMLAIFIESFLKAILRGYVYPKICEHASKRTADIFLMGCESLLSVSLQCFLNKPYQIVVNLLLTFLEKGLTVGLMKLEGWARWKTVDENTSYLAPWVSRLKTMLLMFTNPLNLVRFISGASAAKAGEALAHSIINCVSATKMSESESVDLLAQGAEVSVLAAQAAQTAEVSTSPKMA